MLQILTTLLFPTRTTPLHLQVAEYIQANKISPVITTKAQLQKRGIVHLDSVYATCSYHTHRLIEQAICQAKFNAQPELLPMLAQLCIHWQPTPAGALCAVPLHWTRRFTRGYNQSQILAVELANITNMPILHCLKRIRPTGHQAKRTRAQRLSAMQHAFIALGNVPNIIYVVDDICTTGATLDACAAALKTAGANEVHAITIAQS